MKGLVVLVFLLSLALCPKIQAGTNPDAKAWVSWNPDWNAPVADLDTMPAGFQYLYIQLAEISEIGGYSFTLRWCPEGYREVWPTYRACYYNAGRGGGKSEDDTDCDGLLRGLVHIHRGVTWGPGYWSSSPHAMECNSACPSGNAAYAVFEFDSCYEIEPGTFCLDYFVVYDCSAGSDYAEVVGDASILGGVPFGQYPCAQSNIIRGSTWGAVKAMYE